MKRKRLAAAVCAALTATVMTQTASADGFSKVFQNPKVGGKKLDGCFSFPGSCRPKAQADAFCKMRGYAFASDFKIINQAGFFQAKRLGDGGTCTASCTVMTRVVCIAEGHDYE